VDTPGGEFGTKGAFVFPYTLATLTPSNEVKNKTINNTGAILFFRLNILFI